MIALALLIVWVIALLAFGAIHWNRPPRERLGGWWHQQVPGTHAWTPKAWRQACHSSLVKSRTRRGLM